MLVSGLRTENFEKSIVGSGEFTGKIKKIIIANSSFLNKINHLYN